jgi:hypothetical protein
MSTRNWSFTTASNSSKTALDAKILADLEMIYSGKFLL